MENADINIETHPNGSRLRMVLVWVVRIIVLLIGIFLGSVAVVLFLDPFNIAPTGISGLSVFLNRLIGTPIGVMIFLMNIPIVYMAYRFLGGWQTAFFTVVCVGLYSVMLDLLKPYMPVSGISDDLLLNSIFGGIVGGIGTAMVQRVGGTFGGTSTLAVILQKQIGTPLSTTYLYTDMATVIMSGFIFSWESALFATVALFMTGIATDYILEGPSVVRIATIITDKPEEVSQAVISMGRGVTAWDARGMYTHQPRTILYVTISRAQVNQLRDLVLRVDDRAFMVIEQGHTAYGQGFRKVRRFGGMGL